MMQMHSLGLLRLEDACGGTTTSDRDFRQVLLDFMSCTAMNGLLLRSRSTGLQKVLRQIDTQLLEMRVLNLDLSASAFLSLGLFLVCRRSSRRLCHCRSCLHATCCAMNGVMFHGVKGWIWSGSMKDEGQPRRWERRGTPCLLPALD